MSGTLTLTEWPIRALGTPLRMALHFAAVPFEEVSVNDPAKWFGADTARIGAVNPLVNLPNLTLPDGEVVVQSYAALRHIGRTYGLYGGTAGEAARVDQVLEVLSDVRKEYGKVAYASPDEYDDLKQKFAETVTYNFSGLDKFLLLNKTAYIASDAVTIADFSVVHNMVNCAAVWEAGDEVGATFAPYPALLAYYARVTALPGLAAYFASPAAAFPFNGPSANFSQSDAFTSFSADDE
jgi:glutathione S-transferase